jgi:HPt (histidine-containing phosphotransfer) domain-containing protein
MNTIHETKVTDLTYLNDLAKGDDEFVTEMLSIFINENPIELKNIENGIETSDYQAIKNAAHKLRSTIPFVGIDKLIEKETIEMEQLAADKGDLNQIKNLFSKVQEVCRKALLELKPVEDGNIG